MDIDFDSLLLSPLHAGLGMDAVVEPAGAVPFSARLMRHYPAADLATFAVSQAQTDLYVFEVRKSLWPQPLADSYLTISKIGRLRVQAVRPDERQPEIWLLDCYLAD